MCAAFLTLSSVRAICNIFAQNHSEEYIPPTYLVTFSPPQFKANSLISLASFIAVWSFQSTIIAFGLFSNSFVNANGIPSSVTGTGEEPVVSIQILFI